MVSLRRHVNQIIWNKFYWVTLWSNFPPGNERYHLRRRVPIGLHHLFQIDSWWPKIKVHQNINTITCVGILTDIYTSASELKKLKTFFFLLSLVVGVDVEIINGWYTHPPLDSITLYVKYIKRQRKRVIPN